MESINNHIKFSRVVFIAVVIIASASLSLFGQEAEIAEIHKLPELNHTESDVTATTGAGVHQSDDSKVLKKISLNLSNSKPEHSEQPTGLNYGDLSDSEGVAESDPLKLAPVEEPDKQPVEPEYEQPDPQDMPEAMYDSPEHMRLMALNQENDPNIFTEKNMKQLEFTVPPGLTAEQLQEKIEFLKSLIEKPELIETEKYREAFIPVPWSHGMVMEKLSDVPLTEKDERNTEFCNSDISVEYVIEKWTEQLSQMREEGFESTNGFIKKYYDNMLYFRTPQLTQREYAYLAPAAREHLDNLKSLEEPPQEYLDQFLNPARKEYNSESPRTRPMSPSNFSGWYEYWDGSSSTRWDYNYNWTAYYYGSFYSYYPTTGDLCYISNSYGYYNHCYIYNANTYRVYQVIVVDSRYLRIYNSKILYIGNPGDSNWEYTLVCGSGSRIRCEGSGRIDIDNYTSSTSCNAPTPTCNIGACFTVDGYFDMYSGYCYLDDDLIVHGTVTHTGGNIYCGYSNRSYDGALYVSGATSARYIKSGGNLYVERYLYTSGGYGSYGRGNGYFRSTGGTEYIGYDGSARNNSARIYIYDSADNSYFNYLRVYGNTNLYCGSGRELDVNSHFYIYSGYHFYANGYTMYVRGNFYDCLLYTSPSPRDLSTSRMPSSA